jgi:hypothetical protein
MEIKEKDNYINNITALLIPDAKPGEMNMETLQNNNVTFNNLISRLQELEKENKILKNQSEDAKISEALARENAKLRIKIKDLEDRLCSG